MADVYKVKTGHDVALVSLDDISPQPTSKGIQFKRRTYSADGQVYEQGAFVVFEWNMLETAAQYQAILTSFGLNDTTLTANVTVYVRNSIWNWTRLNGVAVKPESGKDTDWTSFFPRNISLLVKNLATPS